MTKETWRSIPGFGGAYSASDQGRIRSEEREVPRGTDGHTLKIREKFLTLTEGKHGHLYTRLWKNNTEHRFLVHRLIALTFIGPQPEGKPYVLHGDGNPTNNVVGNLRWGSQADNMQDAVKHGTQRNQNTGKLHCLRGHTMTPRSSGYGRECKICHKITAINRIARLEPLEPDDPRHGTANAYSHFKCRCVACKKGKSDRDRAYRERKKRGNS